MNFSDPLPLDGLNQLVVAGTPNVSLVGCGTGVLSSTASPANTALAGGNSMIYFFDGVIAAYGTCTIEVDVTVAADGDYDNITNHLFIDVNGENTDTTNFGEDTLKVASVPLVYLDRFWRNGISRMASLFQSAL